MDTNKINTDKISNKKNDKEDNKFNTIIIAIFIGISMALSSIANS